MISGISGQKEISYFPEGYVATQTDRIKYRQGTIVNAYIVQVHVVVIYRRKMR